MRRRCNTQNEPVKPINDVKPRNSVSKIMSQTNKTITPAKHLSAVQSMRNTASHSKKNDLF